MTRDQAAEILGWRKCDERAEKARLEREAREYAIANGLCEECGRPGAYQSTHGFFCGMHDRGHW